MWLGITLPSAPLNNLSPISPDSEYYPSFSISSSNFFSYPISISTHISIFEESTIIHILSRLRVPLKFWIFEYKHLVLRLSPEKKIKLFTKLTVSIHLNNSIRFLLRSCWCSMHKSISQYICSQRLFDCYKIRLQQRKLVIHDKAFLSHPIFRYNLRLNLQFIQPGQQKNRSSWFHFPYPAPISS